MPLELPQLQKRGKSRDTYLIHGHSEEIVLLAGCIMFEDTLVLVRCLGARFLGSLLMAAFSFWGYIGLGDTEGDLRLLGK